MTGIWWLASYPKSGNTWVRAFLASLRRDGGAVDLNALDIPIAAARPWFDHVAGVPSSLLTDAEIEAVRPACYRVLAAEATEPLILKVHDAWQPALFPVDATAGVVCIVRDPRDVAVSFAHHLGKTIDEAIAAMADPANTIARTGPGLAAQLPQRLSSWSAHVESWLDGPGVPVHLLRYEHMAADPASRLGGVARFVGLEASAEAVAIAVAASRFDTLQAQEAGAGFIERPARMAQFFRRGVAGGWRDSLTPAQANRIVRDHGPMMARLGYRL